MLTKPVTLDQWLEHIQSVHFRSVDLNLDRVRRVKHVLRLDRRPIIISIAGTNGKGSSVAMLESVLLSAGEQVGTYTSPHLVHYGERIRINGNPSCDAQLVKAFAAVESARTGIPLTYFEFGTLVALWLFHQARIRVAILEVGMGGLFDAVNIETPDVALLTQIGIDHEQWLGVGKAKIGAQKAGILRFQGLAVINDPDPPGSVIDRARQLRCKYLSYGVDYLEEQTETQWDWIPMSPAVQSFSPEIGLPTPSLGGRHQVQNAAGVVAVLRLLTPVFLVSRGALENGLKRPNIRARLEVLPGSVEKIVDVCHNVAAVACLADYLSQHPVIGRTFVVFAMLKDKDVEGVVRRLMNRVDRWYLTELNARRGIPLLELEAVVLAIGVTCVQSYPVPKDALMRAEKDANPGDRIVICGSVYLAGAILPILDHETLRE